MLMSNQHAGSALYSHIVVSDVSLMASVILHCLVSYKMVK